MASESSPSPTPGPSVHQGASTAEGPAPRYDFTIDASADTTHTAIIRLVGSGKRVLELGPATGYMSEVLTSNGCTVVGIEGDPEMARLAAEHCERVIVGDIDTLDLDAELASERFDVIVAADVLEHLRDPLGVLRRLRPFLEPSDGAFVVSLPNVAHGSVRLALLQGSFSYQDRGLLDRTHLRFFTKESMEQLFDEAGLAIVHVDRRQLALDASEVHFDVSGVPEELLRHIEADPDARTYQFVVRALPVDAAVTRRLEETLREQSFALDEARHARDRAVAERDQARDELASVEGLRETLEAIAARERSVRASLIEAHDQLLRRDEELRRLNSELDRLSGAVEERDRLVSENAELWKAQNEARVIIDVRDAELRRLDVRLSRLLNSLPFRTWRRVGRLPLIRRAATRRTAAYEAEVRQGESRAR